MNEDIKEFDQELAYLESELKESKDLYDELKLHFDNVRESRGSGVLRFISDQARNLISLKSHNISIIKEKALIRKMKIELDKKNNSDENNLELLKGMLSLINSSKNDFEISDYDNEEFVEEIDFQLDNKLINIFFEDLKEDKLQLVVDEEKNLYVINSDYEVVEDIEIPELEITFVKKKKELKAYYEDIEIEIINTN